METIIITHTEDIFIAYRKGISMKVHELLDYLSETKKPLNIEYNTKALTFMESVTLISTTWNYVASLLNGNYETLYKTLKHRLNT